MLNTAVEKIVSAPLWLGASAAYPPDPALKKHLSRVCRFDTPFQLYQEAGNTILVPRGMAPSTGLEDRRVKGEAMNFKGPSLFKPRTQEQELLVGQSVALHHKGVDHIFEAPTGFGKTVVGTEVALRVGRKTLVLVTKGDIVKQWRDSYCMLTGRPSKAVGLIQGDTCDVMGKDFVIGMVQSLMKPGRYPPWVYSLFGLIIPDEVHRMGADVFSLCMWQFPAMHRMGLSATPRRKDGKDVVITSHIGPVMVRAKAKALKFKVIRAQTKYQVPRVRRTVNGQWRTIQLPHSAGKTMHLSKDMARDDHRNQIAVNFIYQAYKKGRNTVVFSDIKQDYFDHLKMLLQMKGIKGSDIGYYCGGMKQKDLDAAKVKPVVITTYKMTSEATDCPWWDTCVLMHPKADVIQIVGRIRREYPDKKLPIVFDLVDSDSDVFAGYARARLRWYRREQATVVE